MSFWPKHPAQGPQAPSLRIVVIRTGVPGAEVRLADEAVPSVADGQGDAHFMVSNAVTAFNLHLRGAGRPPYDLVVPLPPGDKHFNVGPQIPITNPTLEIALPPWGPPRVFPAEAGLVTRDGSVFRNEGRLWQWRGCTHFLLFFRFLKGEDIQPQLDEVIALGFNVLRVLGMVDWDDLQHAFWPQRWPAYYTRLFDFCDLLARNGLRCEFVIFADAQLVMDATGEQERHIDNVFRVLKTKWNIFPEVANEPFKNITGGAARAFALGERWGGGTPLLIASGAGVVDIAEGDFAQLAAWTLDRVTIHDHERGPEWPRKMKDALEVRQGLGDRWPVTMDEPLGADETSRPSRSNVPDDFAYAAAVLALQGHGGTFHCEAWLRSTLLPPVQKACAQAWVGAMKTIGPEAQSGQYTAGHLSTCPIEHSDELALRTFGSILGNRALVVVVRPTAAWTPKPKDGWQIVARQDPHGAILELTR